MWNELLSEPDSDSHGRAEIQCVRFSSDDAENDQLGKERFLDVSPMELGAPPA